MNRWADECRLYLDERLPGTVVWQHALKVNEEAGELGRAVLGRGDIAEECADVLISTMLLCARVGIDVDEVIGAKFRALWERTP
jgi:NTP pyrophosphatase (non-canonical NTP hydrolase)